MLFVAKDIMSLDPIAVPPEMDLSDAYATMQAYRIQHLLVMRDNSELVGILTESDILRLSSNNHGQRLIPQLPVSDLMTRTVITCLPTSALSDVAAAMISAEIGSLPVVKDGKVFGIITRTDLLDLFCQQKADDSHASVTVIYPQSANTAVESLRLKAYTG